MSLITNSINKEAIEDEDPMSVFLYALKAPESRRQYPQRLRIFLDYLKIEGPIGRQTREFLAKAKTNPAWVQSTIMKFVAYQKERVHNGEISSSTISNYYKAIKLFIDMNTESPVINWKKVARGLPAVRKAANDRAPTIEELRKLAEYPDRRIKSIVYVMASSGIRLGAWDTLQWKHVSPITNDKGDIIAARLRIYHDSPEAYYTFITPESYFALKNWIDFRIAAGEQITDDSWLMRDLWQTTEMNYGARFGFATFPKQLKSSGIKSLLERAIRAQGLCKSLPVGVRRREWKGAHGMRKFYKTHAEQMMIPINVEITMGHDVGVSESYYKPTEREILQDYLKAVDVLTINGDKSRLQKQVEELKQETKNNEYIISGKLQKKDHEIEQLRQSDKVKEDALKTLSDQVMKLMVEVQELKKSK